MTYKNYIVLYAEHVNSGKRTIESVPKTIREEVKEVIKSLKNVEGHNNDIKVT